MTVSKIAAGVALAFFLAGCASQPSSRSGGSGYEMENERYSQAPELDPTRRVSVQDCTRSIRIDGGNLRCR
jgi:hypothetical protein